MIRVVSKRAITMLELLISLTLTVLILSTLTYFYHQLTMAGMVLDRQQSENFQERYVENRLMSVLPRTISSTDASNEFHFFTSQEIGHLFSFGSQSLVFTFDNCVQLNKDMAYHVIGRLFLDNEGRFILATWPSEKRWKENEPIPFSREVLMEGVSQLRFTFFVPLKKERLDSKVEDDPLEGVRGGWIDRWDSSYRQLPALIKVIITRQVDDEETELIFAYPFPHTLQPITYDG